MHLGHLKVGLEATEHPTTIILLGKFMGAALADSL